MGRGDKDGERQKGTRSTISLFAKFIPSLSGPEAGTGVHAHGDMWAQPHASPPSPSQILLCAKIN